MRCDRVWLLSVVIAGVGAGCSGGGGSSLPLSTCASREGQFLTSKEWSQQCLIDGVKQETITLKCADGRTLFWDNFGWSFSNETYKRHQTTTKAPPGEAMRDCEPGGSITK